jgi:uncharacterized protein (TIGR03086 family)
MSAEADRFRRIAADFTTKVEGVPDGRWDDQSPVPEWVARDVVRHLVEWMPGLFFTAWDIEAPAAPSVDEDPVAAWAAVRDAFQAALDDPELAVTERDIPPGPMTFAAAVDMLATSDVFMHTWDLARATGQDDTLDPEEATALLAGMEPMDEVLRQSGHYGPRVEVADDASPGDRLMAFVGRTPQEPSR